MNPELLNKRLTTKTLGRNKVLLKETDSTNSHAARLHNENRLSHGTVIIAEKQTAGRGRLERPWFSDGCLTMTVILKVNPQTASLSPITLTAGTAATLGISELAERRFQVKYPNDIMHNGRKLGGILTELKTGREAFILLGIGINVEQKTFPVEIADKAVSLIQLGIETTREEVAAAVLNRLEPMIILFMREGFSRIRPLWLEVNCTLGKWTVVNQPSGIVEGKAIDIGDDGALIIETAGGIEKVTTGDFSFKD